MDLLVDLPKQPRRFPTPTRAAPSRYRRVLVPLVHWLGRVGPKGLQNRPAEVVQGQQAQQRARVLVVVALVERTTVLHHDALVGDDRGEKPPHPAVVRDSHRWRLLHEDREGAKGQDGRRVPVGGAARLLVVEMVREGDVLAAKVRKGPPEPVDPRPADDRRGSAADGHGCRVRSPEAGAVLAVLQAGDRGPDVVRDRSIGSPKVAGRDDCLPEHHLHHNLLVQARVIQPLGIGLPIGGGLLALKALLAIFWHDEDSVHVERRGNVHPRLDVPVSGPVVGKEEVRVGWAFGALEGGDSDEVTVWLGVRLELVQTEVLDAGDDRAVVPRDQTLNLSGNDAV